MNRALATVNKRKKRLKGTTVVLNNGYSQIKKAREVKQNEPPGVFDHLRIEVIDEFDKGANAEYQEDEKFENGQQDPSAGLAFNLQVGKKALIQVSGSISNENFGSDINLCKKPYSSSNHETKDSDTRESFFPIDPRSNFKMTWETVKIVLLLYQCYYLPVSVTFLDTNDFVMLYITDKAIDLFFIVDLAFNFVTKTYINHELEGRYKQIAKAYLLGWFIVDLLAVFPSEDTFVAIEFHQTSFQKANFGGSLKLFRFIRLIRLAKFLRLFRSFDRSEYNNYLMEYMAKNSRKSLFLTMLPSFFMLVTCLHCLSCLWYTVAVFVGRNSWVFVNGVEDETKLDLYIYCVYFITMTFTTVGYGDVYSHSNYELSYRIVMILMGAVVYGLFSGQIIDFRARAMITEGKLQHQLQILDQFRRLYKIDRTTIHQITDGLQDQKNVEANKYDLSILQDDLDDFYYELFIRKFKDIKLFTTAIKDQESVINLGLKLKKKKFAKDDVIYSKGQSAALFYVLKKGEVGLTLEMFPSIPFVKIKTGFFGEFELLRNIQREFTAVALTDCVLYTLFPEDFKRIIVINDENFADQMLQSSKTRQEKFSKYYQKLQLKVNGKIFWKLVFGKNSGKLKKSKIKIHPTVDIVREIQSKKATNDISTLFKVNTPFEIHRPPPITIGKQSSILSLSRKASQKDLSENLRLKDTVASAISPSFIRRSPKKLSERKKKLTRQIDLE